jgi:DNA-binding NarL/FixJ family response regulator
MEGKLSLARGPARILIADEHDLVREGLKAVLEGESDLKVVGEAKDGCEVLRLCRRLRPDVVLMDLRMRGVDGLEATRAIRKEQPSTAVVIVTLLEPANYFLEALKAGAADYVLKDAPHCDLVSTIQRVYSSGRFSRNMAGWHMEMSPQDHHTAGGRVAVERFATYR